MKDGMHDFHFIFLSRLLHPNNLVQLSIRAVAQLKIELATNKGAL